VSSNVDLILALMFKKLLKNQKVGELASLQLHDNLGKGGRSIDDIQGRIRTLDCTDAASCLL
jgi:hypothetical protein